MLIKMLDTLKDMLFAKTVKLEAIAHEHYLNPIQELKDQYIEALKELEQVQLEYNERLVEYLRLTNLVDVVNVYFHDNADDGRTFEDYHHEFTQLQKLQMAVAQQSALYADYIEEELDDFYNDYD